MQLLIAFIVVAGASGDASALAINLASPHPQPVGIGPSHGRPQRSEDGRLGGAGRAQAEGRARNRVGIQSLKRVIDAMTGPIDYTHDALGNLASAAYADGKVDLRMPDAVGNLFRTGDRSDRKYGPAGQLLESRDARGVTTYEYDPEGNLIKKVESDGAVWTYGWNGAGMLASVTRPDGHVVSFTYDALARRLSKTYRGKTTRWIWDGNVPLHEWVERDADAVDQDFTAARQDDAVAIGEKNLKALLAGRPANGPPSPAASAAEASMLAAADCGTAEAPITWLFEPESFAPLAKLVGGERYGIVTDHLGTPRGMFDANGREVWGADVDGYGDLRNLRGEREACPFRWPGQYEDSETGLYYNRWRHYDPLSGQYASQDPIRLEGGKALAAYVHDPLTWVDPLGLACNEAAMDNNSLVNAIEGDGAALAALAGRTPVVSPQAAREFLRGSAAQRAALGEAGARRANAAKLREFLASRGGRIGSPSDAAGRAAAEAAGARRTARNIRQGSAGDPAVVDSAIKDGIPLLTRDQNLLDKFPFTEPF